MKVSLLFIFTIFVSAIDIDFNAVANIHNSEKITTKYKAKEYDRSKAKKILESTNKPDSVIVSKIGEFVKDMAKSSTNMSSNSNNRSNYGLPKSKCSRTSGSYALYKYCTTGSCDGFVSNYALHQLCKHDSPNGFYGSDRNTNINLYLRNGGYLSYDYFSDKAAYQSGKFNSSFQERKNYILYLLNGMTLIRY